MACQVPDVTKLTNNQSFISVSQLAQSAAADIAYELGIALTVGDTIIPLAPFIWGALAIQEVIGLFGGGRPVDTDTNNVIAAYNQSGFWPLHSLASDLAIALKNGAPISDSRPQIQAQFSAWKQGTIQSLQQLAGFAPGQSSPGYWQLQELINTSWAYSKNGEPAVLQVVKAIDCFTETLAALFQSQQTQPPGGTGGGGGGTGGSGGGTGGGGLDPNNDELLDVGNTIIADLNTIIGLLQQTPQGQSDTCCQNVVTAIGGVISQLAIIAQSLSFAPPNPPTTPPDLSGIVTALGGLATAINAYPPALAACCAQINASLNNIATAVASPVDLKPVVDALNKANDQGDVDNFIFQALQQAGVLNPGDVQTLQGIKWSDALSYIHGVKALRAVENFAKHAGADLNTVASDIGKVAGLAGNWAETKITGALKTQRNIIQDVLDVPLQAVLGALKPKPGAPTSIGDIGVNPDTVLADVAAVGLNIYVATALIGLIREGAAEQLAHIAETVLGVLGFEELREVQIGPLVRNGIEKVADLQAKKLFQQELPGAGALAGLQARGLITAQQYFGYVPFTGLPGALWEQTRESAYSGLGARRILPLIQTGLFSAADIADELRFSGLRPASLQRYLAAAPYLSTATERNALRSSIEKAYINGLLSDQELTARIDSAEQNTDRDALILERVRTEKLVVGVKDLEAEYTTMYLGGLIDDPTFRTYLDGIGLQPDMVNFIAGKAEARANATLRRKELAAAAALQRATAAVERKAALENFLNGTFPLPLYMAALEATGLTAVQAAAWADLAALKKAGNVRWVYGLELQPAQATLLKERVTALTDQRKRQIISQQQYVDALHALGISDNWINGLDAAAEAMLTPKLSAFGVPVRTS